MRDRLGGYHANDLFQAVVLSLGLHLLLASFFDVSPGNFDPGIAPRLVAHVSGVTVNTNAAEQLPDPAPLLDSSGANPAPSRTAHSGKPLSPEVHTPEDGLSHESVRSGSTIPVPDLYFTRSQVDVPATPLERTPLIYPAEAYIWKLAGRVQARVFINESGEIDQVSIVHAHPPGIFEEAALAALWQIRYKPALIGGIPVRSQRLVEVGFDPYEQRGEAESAGKTAR